MPICKNCLMDKSFGDFGTFTKHDKQYRYKTCKKCRGKTAWLKRKARMSSDPEYKYKILKSKRSSQLKRMRIWKQNDPEGFAKAEKIRSKRYRDTHKAQRRLANRIRDKRDRSTPIGKLSHQMGCSIRATVNKKGKSWKIYVPYTPEDLLKHLESLFSSEMTWENYGSLWHIDHIRPVSSFNYSSVEDSEFQECWSLKNLRPLRADDNIKKVAGGVERNIEKARLFPQFIQCLKVPIFQITPIFPRFQEGIEAINPRSFQDFSVGHKKCKICHV